MDCIWHIGSVRKQKKITLNLIKLLCIIPRKMTGSVVYPLGSKVLEEIIHKMVIDFEILNVVYLLQLFHVEL